MTRWRQRGVSLIEALVAMGVMAFGMLAVVGLQVTLRTNGDLSKQRAEAVRVAQQSIEDWRAFSVVEVTAGVLDYQDLVTEASIDIAGINATYARTRTSTDWPAALPGGSAPMKTLSVSVAWDDRNGQQQTVQLNTVIAGVAPELSGSLAVPTSGVTGRQPLGRNRSIPVLAKDLGTVSGFMPPQAAGGGVTWVFNNVSGLITGVCNLPGRTTATLVEADVAACSANTLAQLLRGFVQFAAVAAAPNAAEAQRPTGLPMDLDISLALTGAAAHPSPPACFDDAAAIDFAAVPGSAVSYYCAIFSNAIGLWSGRSRVVASGWSIGTVAGQFKICRYTPLAADNPANARNADHPLDYTEAGSAAYASLAGQNFLVIAAAHSCPSDVAAAGDFLNSNTRLHQDGSVAYSN